MARLVRCPKCSKLLVEHTTVPVYKCGGCDTVLRARNKSSNLEEEAESRSLQTEAIVNINKEAKVNTKRNSDSSADGTIPSAEEDPSEGPPDIISENSFSDKEGPPPPSSSSSPSVEELREDKKGPNDGHRRRNLSSDHYQEVQRSVSAKTTGEDAPPLSRIDGETEASTQKAEAVEPEVANCRDEQVRNLSETTGSVGTSSQRYDGSVSSYEDGRRERTLSRHPLSRRTFRSKTIDSTMSTETDRRTTETDKPSSPSLAEDHSRPPVSNSGHGQGPHYAELFRSFNEVKREVISKYESGELQRGMSFDSDDFMSVGSRPEPESPSPLRPRGPQTIFEEHMNLLNKLEELKAQIMDLYRDNRKPFPLKAPSFATSIYNADRLSGPTQCTHLHCLHSHFPSSRAPCTDEKSLPKERPKGHCRPVSRAAPFVVCYHCKRLLQLPTDFVVSQRKLHKLKCGGCSEVLMLSFPEKMRKASDIGDEDGRLHRLMGYESASELLYRRNNLNDIDEEYESLWKECRSSGSVSSFGGVRRGGSVYRSE